MCLGSITVFAALDMADGFYKPSVCWADVIVIHISEEGHSVLTRDSSVQKPQSLAKVQQAVIFFWIVA